MKDLFQKNDNLKKELSAYQPLGGEQEQKLWRKFRLEWNYNSNHIEGNTLTYGHTEMLLLLGKVTGDYELREIEEMKAHDVAINFIRNQAKEQNRDLTEADIRELNKIILVEPFWKEAITPEGQPTKREIVPGTYKKMPNHVKLSNGETFFFASPEETPIAMGELLDWYRSESAAGKVHPAELAALFHYKLVRIHQFDDNNGRTSRLVMNYVLLRNNYPPVIIKSSDKRNYFFALSKADTGDVGAIVEYVGKQLLWSLELSLKVAKGESIEELDDLKKEIEIYKRENQNSLKGITVKSLSVLIDVYSKSISPLFESVQKEQNLFDDFCVKNEISLNDGSVTKIVLREVDILEYLIQSHRLLSERNKSNPEEVSTWDNQLSLNIYREHLISRRDSKFRLSRTLKVTFSAFAYVIEYNGERIISKDYKQSLSTDEIQLVSSLITRDIFSAIKAEN